ncbi:hypothetical protein PROFUN_01989 [Planoprotostelium fungivorum]|uniref:glucose-6-phosphate 1-epimerase n=1 Tax=Planoprotostelium fungivorum TaxID=1890364 RepID=A0A2P6NB24_9EUKA|nr:hypothetical protein PROFUN_01989 [Planoprotostelium fungivorum]
MSFEKYEKGDAQSGPSIRINQRDSNSEPDAVSTFVTLKSALGSTVTVYLHGAHVTSFKDADGQELFFLSEKSYFKKSESIRGGIPICWPQFADEGPLPMHGICHSTEWTIKETSISGNHPRIVFTLDDSQETRNIWPHSFHLQYTVEIVEGEGNKERLRLSLDVENKGDADFSWTAALHTYYHVNSLRQTSVSGLKGKTFIDKTKKKEKFEEKNDHVTFQSETDKIFVCGASDDVIISDASDDQIRYKLHFEGWRDVVMWNPWVEKAKEIPDFVPSEYDKMLCLEATQLTEPVKLSKGNKWSGLYTIGRA